MIAIIPARGGSKGLPGKNIKNLNGKPMLAYTIEAALQSNEVSDVIISTDDEEIYNTAIKYGASKTFLRPPELAQDNSLAVDNYIYTADKLNVEYGYDTSSFVVLQPTSPLRTADDIDGAIKLFKQNDADSVISYTEAQHPLEWHKYIDESGRFENVFGDSIGNRQSSKLSYYPNGAVFVFSLNLIKQRKYYSDKSFAYLMPRSRSVDVDAIEDFDYVEFLMRKKSEKHVSVR